MTGDPNSPVVEAVASGTPAARSLWSSRPDRTGLFRPDPATPPDADGAFDIGTDLILRDSDPSALDFDRGGADLRVPRSE